MRLYRTPSGRWWGTQADARQACLDEAVPSNAWEQIDVPDDKSARLEWLNRNVGCAAVEASRAEAELDRLRESEAVRAEARTWLESAAPPSPPTEHSRRFANETLDLIAVEEFIQAADHRALASITSNAIHRMRELLDKSA